MMELREILAIRLRSLMDNRPDLDTQIKLHERTGMSQSTIQRVLSRKVHTGLDVLQALADAFGVTPLSLLQPLKPGEESVAVAPTIEEITLLQQWRQLDTLEKHTVIGYIGLVVTSKAKQVQTTDKYAALNSDSPVEPHLLAAVQRATKPQVNEEKVGTNNNEQPKQGQKRIQSGRLRGA